MLRAPSSEVEVPGALECFSRDGVEGVWGG